MHVELYICAKYRNSYIHIHRPQYIHIRIESGLFNDHKFVVSAYNLCVYYWLPHIILPFIYCIYLLERCYIIYNIIYNTHICGCGSCLTKITTATAHTISAETRACALHFVGGHLWVASTRVVRNMLSALCIPLHICIGGWMTAPHIHALHTHIKHMSHFLRVVYLYIPERVCRHLIINVYTNKYSVKLSVKFSGSDYYIRTYKSFSKIYSNKFYLFSCAQNYIYTAF